MTNAVRRSIRRREIVPPVELSWRTRSTRAFWRSAAAIEWATRSTLMGSISPVTLTMSTRCARRGRGRRRRTRLTSKPDDAGEDDGMAMVGRRRLIRLEGVLDPRAFCSSTRVLIVAGKGGVGKTTVSAALARMAARAGLLDPDRRGRGQERAGRAVRPAPARSTTARSVLAARRRRPRRCRPEVRARTLTPDDALVEYLDDHGMRRISKRLVALGALDVVATAVPGIKDILVLGKVKQLEAGAGEKLDPRRPGVRRPHRGRRTGRRPRGHVPARAPRACSTPSASAPSAAQAADVVDLLGDPARCQVMLVTLPEETPVNEVIETAYSPGGPGRGQAGPGRRQRRSTRRSPASTPTPARRPGRRGRRSIAGEADALRAAADFRRQRQELQAEQVGTAGRRAAAAPAAAAVPLHRPSWARPSSTRWPTPLGRPAVRALPRDRRP